MREIKYVSHLSRNALIYFIIFLANALLFKTTLSPQIFFLGLITFFIAYAPVYFFNDFADYKEDLKYKKSNLYLLIKNKIVFWTLAILLLLTGFFLSYSITPLSVIFLVALYLMNLAYSYPPLRIRNRLFLREILIFIINLVKTWLVLLYLNQSISNFPLLIVVMGSSMMAYGVTLYKRYLGESKPAGTLFGALFVITWIWIILVYKQLFWMLLPLIPLAALMYSKHKNKQIPIGKYQIIYFIYCIFVYIFYLYF